MHICFRESGDSKDGVGNSTGTSIKVSKNPLFIFDFFFNSCKVVQFLSCEWLFEIFEKIR